MGLRKKCEQWDIKQFLVFGGQTGYMGIMALCHLEGCAASEMIPVSGEVSRSTGALQEAGLQLLVPQLTLKLGPGHAGKCHRWCWQLLGPAGLLNQPRLQSFREVETQL